MISALRHSARAFSWFLGDNDLSTPLVDIETGKVEWLVEAREKAKKEEEEKNARTSV